MGLEALTPSTFIAGLTKEWPTAGEPKSQGDDHIRLIKGVLQNTFPNATGPFYLPSTGVGTGGGSTTLTMAQNGQSILYDTTAGNATVTLPALGVTDLGWHCEILKYSTDANAITVSPPSGNIFGQFGPTSTVRVGVTASPAKFLWNGSAWFCIKNGPMIGSTINFDGTGTPAGHLVLDGTVFSGTTFAELALALGTTTLRDKRGRTEVGEDTLGLLAGVVASAVGSVGGAGAYLLSASHIPSVPVTGSASVSVTVYPAGNPGLYVPYAVGAFAGGGPVGGGGVPYDTTNVSNSTNSFSGGGSGSITGSSTAGGVPHPNVQPTIVVRKLVRAC